MDLDTELGASSLVINLQKSNFNHLGERPLLSTAVLIPHSFHSRVPYNLKINGRKRPFLLFQYNAATDFLYVI